MSAGELSIPLRTYHWVSVVDQPRDEARFHYYERTVAIPVSQAALVLVDVWDQHYITSTQLRSEEITRFHIKPVLAAARRLGTTPPATSWPEVDTLPPRWRVESGDGARRLICAVFTA